MKEKKSLSVVVIVSTFMVFTIALFLTIYCINNYGLNSKMFFSKYNKELNNELKVILDNQAMMDKKIMDISQNGGYTIEKPCIINNPYDISPLSSIAIFNTKDDVNVFVYINDKLVTSTEKTKKHIVPIYGLYSHTNNVVKLVTSDNQVYETIIKTNIYNYDLGNIDAKKEVDENEQLFVLGNISNNKSNLRGFDNYGNLLFYLDLDYISGVSYQNDRMLVEYNSKFTSSNIDNLKLEIDYMGKIHSISKDTSELKTIPNVLYEDEKYITFGVDMYQDEIKNYEPYTFIDSSPADEKIQVYTSDLEDLLKEADVYNEDYELVINGEYITYDFKNQKNVYLAIIGKDPTYTNLYSLDDKNTIKIDLKGELSLYLKINNSYYNLLTTINN